MLEAKHLFKEYKTKNSPIVKALDDVSIKFEETGMVFILGKSGSGKSTLLNVLGGLDKYDSGEVIVKGKSSKDFSQADFDSYRNTFIGFIFQDYNILEEFTISKNIGLALELQGKKADKKQIEALMEQVDLKGFGKRKPNTLSGGQKQRVAIARALVKNPEIIMADEPTGALDSNTGRQVLDTLKKLSKTKLVLIVSHDREFAEYYGDRIIELSDGKIISDVTKHKSAPKDSSGLEIVDDTVLTIKQGTLLDAPKARALKDFLVQHRDKDIIVTADEKANKEFKKFARIDEDGNKESFRKTERIDVKNYNVEDFELIRSKLPQKDSFKMGASSLKNKPVRLFFTILLSAIAFGLFGLADTLGSYNKVDNTIASIRDSKIDYATFEKNHKERPDEDWYNSGDLSKQDVEYLNSQVDGVEFDPVFDLFEYGGNSIFQDALYNTDEVVGYGSLYRSYFYGFMELSEENKHRVGSLVAGRLPSKDNEIVITKYTYDLFSKAGYKAENNTEIKITEYKDLLNKTIRLNYREDFEFEIVGIIDTGCDLSKYEYLLDEHHQQNIMDMLRGGEIEYYLTYSYHLLGYLNKGYLQRHLDIAKDFEKAQNADIYGYVANSMNANNGYYSIEYIAPYSEDIDDSVYYFDSTKKELNNNEVFVTWDYFSDLGLDINGIKKQFYSVASDYLSEYFKKTKIKNEIEKLYNIRLPQEIENYNNNFDLDWYINSIKGYVVDNSWDSRFLPITGSELEVIYGARNHVLSNIAQYLPKKLFAGYGDRNDSEYSIAGIYFECPIANDNYALGVVSTSLYEQVKHKIGGIYDFAIARYEPGDTSVISDVVKLNYKHDGEKVKYSLKNEVMANMESINSMIETLAQVFLYIGLGFAVFASLLLFNFITVSISYKKREIGVLRAIGARSMDVFKIFFNEALLIALINFVIATVMCFIVCGVLNNVIRNDYGMLITLLNIGVRQIVLMLAISVLVAFISSFFPVRRIARKKPIDAIRNT